MDKVRIKKRPGQKPILPKGGYGFVIGNGTSRKDFDIKVLMDYGIVYGCNWFFKNEFRPHVLVCSDEPITKTITAKHSGYPKNNWAYTWFQKPGSGWKKIPTPEKFAAGPSGAYIAAHTHECSKVFLIGMDFFGFGSKSKNSNGVMNNLYEGYKHYAQKPESGLNGAPTYRNWQRRYEWILKSSPDTEFYHVAPFEGKSPERLRGYKNFHQITWENLMDHLNGATELDDILEKTEEDIQIIQYPNEDDLRASLERQLAGQENILFADMLTNDQVELIKLKGHATYKKDPNAMLAVPLLWFNDITIPKYIFNDSKTGKTIIPTDDQVIQLHRKDEKKRRELLEQSNMIPIVLDPNTFPQAKFLKEKVEAKEDMEDLPPPPPPLSE